MVFNNPPLEVAVVGGGIGGLALGQLLQSAPDIKITVYERSPQLFDRLSGYRVMIAPETLDMLRANLQRDVWDAILPSLGLQPKAGQELVFMKNDGSVMHKWGPEEFRDCLSVSRWKFRQALLHGNDNFVELGKEFKNYQKQPNGRVKVNFADGTDITCDLLVGADGLNSRVRSQLLPYSRTKQTDLAVIYFKVPLTPETRDLLPVYNNSMIFCSNNQNIHLHIWQNPEQLWASEYDLHNIAVDDSFIMFGYGGPITSFLNQSKPPNKLSSMELKVEVIERARRSGVDDNLLALAEMCVVNTAHVQMVKKTKEIRPWDDSHVTLLGDAVLGIPTTLGKGANCALMDAVSLADMLMSFASLPYPVPPMSWRIALQNYVEENITRREVERRRSAFMQNVLYFGGNSITASCRDLGLRYALRWIERPEEHDQKRNVSKYIPEMGSINSSVPSVSSVSTTATGQSEKSDSFSSNSW